MNKKHFYAAVILLLFLVVGIQPAFATTWIIGPDQETPVIPPETIGTWNEGTRTFTLAGDTPPGDNIQIIDNNLILDGAGYKITGSGSGTGISLENQRYVTVKNLTVEGFVTGIRLYNSHNSDENKRKGYNTIKDNTISSEGAGINIGASNWNTVNNNTVSTCAYGIDLEGSSNNTVTDNTVGSSSEAGIRLIEGLQGPLWVGSDNNTLTGNKVTGVSVTQGNGISIELCSYNTLTSNTVSNNNSGIKLWSCNNISLITNSISNNYWGIHLYISNNNALTGNNVLDNTGGILLDTSCNENNLTSNTVLRTGPGFYLWKSSNNNTLTGNTASNNKYGIILKDSTSNNTLTGNNISDNVGGDYVGGIHLDNCSNGNKIYHNNFIDNTGQANVEGCTGNEFFKTDNPNKGGNYWCNWCPPEHPDANGDGFVDEPYLFNIDSQDDFPWACQDGWLLPDTTPPEITCPGNTTIEAMGPDGVPVDDERIQTFLAGASATDNCDPEPTITNDAPAVFLPGDTIVTFTATDASGNSSSCSSTLTVVEAAEANLRIIPRIINREGRLEKILAVIRFPEGTTEEDIDIGQTLILYPGDSLNGVEAINQRIVTWYRWGTLRVSLFASFSKDEVTAGVPEDGQVEMMIIGRFMDGQYFYGLDNVRIISWD